MGQVCHLVGVNTLVDDLNALIKLVAEELGPWGGVYIDDYNEGFNDHLFCEHREPKCIHSNKNQDKDMETKIWSYKSPWFDKNARQPIHNDGEGSDRSEICASDAETRKIQTVPRSDRRCGQA